MTTTITNQYGIFTADTEKEALKLSRAAARKVKKQEKINQENRATAYANAKSRGCDVLSRYVEGEIPRDWRVSKPEDSTFPKSQMDDSYRVYGFHTDHGYAKLGLYSGWNVPSKNDKLVGVLECGFNGIAIIWLEVSGEVQTHAVGVCRDQTVRAKIGSIPIDHFNRANTAEESAPQSEAESA